MRNGALEQLRHIKLTVSLKGSLPCSVQLYTSQEFVNENIALPDAILKNKFLEESVIVFDRGLQTRKKFAEFSRNEILFVARAKTSSAYKLIKQRPLEKMSAKSSVRILSDLEVSLIGGDYQVLPEVFRLVKAEIKKTSELIYFITNYMAVSAEEIAAIYKQRWEIECFFSFSNSIYILNISCAGMKTE